MRCRTDRRCKECQEKSIPHECKPPSVWTRVYRSCTQDESNVGEYRRALLQHRNATSQTYKILEELEELHEDFLTQYRRGEETAEVLEQLKRIKTAKKLLRGFLKIKISV